MPKRRFGPASTLSARPTSSSAHPAAPPADLTQRVERFGTGIPFCRMSSSKDVAGALRRLASDAGRFITKIGLSHRRWRCATGR